MSKDLAAFQAVGKLTEVAQMYRHLLARLAISLINCTLLFSRESHVLADLTTDPRVTNARITIDDCLLGVTRSLIPDNLKYLARQCAKSFCRY